MKRLIITLLLPILTISIECRADNLQLSSRQVSTGDGLPGNTFNGLLVQAPDLNSSPKPLNDQAPKRLITSQADKVFLTKLENMVKARMEKAADLLADGELNVSEVSYKVGIQDPSYFNKLFKSYYGVLPSKYVREAQ